MYKVLIVEDEDIIRKGLIFTMDWTKYNCVVADEAVNGADALEKIRRIHPDIVITDVKMPFRASSCLRTASANIATKPSSFPATANSSMPKARSGLESQIIC